MNARLIAAAIFGGCVVIAIALYLGLRASRPAPPAIVPSMPVKKVDRATLEKRVSDDVQAALRARIPHWIETCWKPALASAPEPTTSKYTFDISIDPRGNEIARGISEVRDEPSRSDVAQCIRSDVERARVRPPGETVRVNVWVRLPN